jgi:hypothetical protein
LCATELAFKGGSTGTMANNIKLVHKSVRLDATKTSADDSEKQQRKLTDYAKPTMCRQKWIVCTEKLSLMCAQDLRPISIVNGEGFIDLCRELNPSYDVPGPSTVSTYFTKMHRIYIASNCRIYNLLPIAMVLQLCRSDCPGCQNNVGATVRVVKTTLERLSAL